MTETINRTRSKQPGQPLRYVLIGTSLRKAAADFVVYPRSNLSALAHDASRKTVIVSANQKSTENLLKAGLQLWRDRRMGELVTLEAPRPASVPALSALFERHIGASPGYAWLPVPELMTVISSENASDRFIGGAADSALETLTLVRGDRSTHVVPFSYFAPAGDGTRPEFDKLSFGDYGLTVGLGASEASSDGILYEFDAAYRQRLNKQRRQSERTFGAALRRLRLQRGLKQSDFAPLTTKTIARIERNEVSRPHGKTLEVLARRLGVSADQIESY